MGKIIWGGQELDMGEDLEIVRDPAMWFDPSDAGCGLRREPPKLFVVHWSGGEQGCEGIYETLIERELSVEFAMNWGGEIQQFADPAKTFCAHAHGVNTVSFGMEIQCRGLVPGVFSPAQLKKLDTKFPRGTYKERIHGRDFSIASFNIDQLEALVTFCDALVENRILRRQVYGLKGKPLLDVVPLAKAKLMQGVIGHLNVSDEKQDPGSQPFEELIAEGWKVVPSP